MMLSGSSISKHTINRVVLFAHWRYVHLLSVFTRQSM